MAGKNVKEKVCNICNESRKMESFITARNKLAFPDGIVNFCKECRDNYIDINNMETVYDILMLIDKPFLRDLWDRAKKETSDPKAVFGKYTKSLNGKQHLNKGFRNDSVFDYSIPVSVEIEEITEVTPEMRKRWKFIKDDIEIIALEEIYLKLITTCEFDGSLPQELIFKNIAKVQLKIERSIVSDPKDIKSLSEMMADAGIKPKDKNASYNSLSFGERVRKYEETEPIPEPLPQWADVDKVMYFINKYFIGTFKKVFGIGKKSGAVIEETIGDNDDEDE